MIYQSLFFAVLAVSKIAFSLPVKEKIKPVELKYYCVKVSAAEDKIHDKIPVLLIHGVGGSHRSWDGVNLHLSFRTKRRVCSVDLRNHGDSPWNKRNDIKALAADIAHFLDRQGIKKVNVIGHSLGGKVAVHFTLTNPNRVNSIVVEDMRPNGMVTEVYDTIVKFFKLLKKAVTQVPPEVTEAEARNSIINFINRNLDQFGTAEKFTKESIKFMELKLVDGRWNFKHNMDVILSSMKDPRIFLGNSSGVYKGPALFIYGLKSSFKVGEDSRNILKMFPNAKLIPVEGADHIIHGEFRKFDDEVIKFLNGIN